MKRFALGFVSATLLLVGCGAAFKFYGLQLPAECYAKGTLLGRQGTDGWRDLPFDQCEPDSIIKGKCVIQLREDFFKKDQALGECVKALKECQQGPPPSN